MCPQTHEVIKRKNIMTTNAKKTKAKRSHHDHPNKANLKASRKREQASREALKKFAEKDKD